MKRTKKLNKPQLSWRTYKMTTPNLWSCKEDQTPELRPPQKLLIKVCMIKGKNGLTTNPAEQSKIIAEYFKETFYKNKQPRAIIPTTRMTISLTANEIRKAIAKMKPNKSPGCDEIPVELIKYAPDKIHEQMAKIYNTWQKLATYQKK